MIKNIFLFLFALSQLLTAQTQPFAYELEFENKIKNADYEGILEDLHLLEKHLNNFRVNLKEQKIY